MDIELKSNITSDVIKKYSFNYDSTRWSKNQYCKDKVAAAEAENKFLADKSQNKFIVLKDIVRPTQKGFFATITYEDENGNLQEVVVFLGLWMLDLSYLPSIEYYGSTNSLQAFLNFYDINPPKLSDEAGIKLATNIQAIETRIPDTNGNFISGGPRRAAIFYFNKQLEDAIKAAANNGKLIDLGIDELDFVDKTHDTFHQGAGTRNPDLKNEYNVTYEVKGPLTAIPNISNKENLNKAADNILRFDGSNLVLYKRQADDTYKEVKKVSFDFKYTEFLNDIADSWDVYWGAIEVF